MAKLIEWEDKLSVSVDSIDEEHKVLIGLVNELNDAMLEGRGNEIMGHVLDELIKYTATHFAHEEQMMQERDYPDYVMHKTEHDLLVGAVVELQKKFEAGQSRISIEVMRFLKEWLQTHILGTDMRLGAFLSKG